MRLACFGDEPLEHGEPLRQLANSLGQPGHREAPVISDQLSTVSRELGTAKTAQTNGRIERTKLTRQRARVKSPDASPHDSMRRALKEWGVERASDREVS